MDLFGPIKVESLAGKKYTLVIVNEFLRFTWVIFLRSKVDASLEIISFIKKMELLYGLKICQLRGDNGTEF